MHGTVLQIGCQTLANDNENVKAFMLGLNKLSKENIDEPKFHNDYKVAKHNISKGVVFANSNPADIVAKISTEAHWARADFKRGYTNMKNAAKNKDWESYEKYKAQFKQSLVSLDRMIGATDVKSI